MKTVGITGGTGFVGGYLTALLVSKGYNVVIFTTRVAKKPARPGVSYAHWSPDKGVFDINGLKDINAVVHLGGAALADKRWTPQRKKEILDSRVQATGFLISQLRQYAPDCKVFIGASATGYYGPDRQGMGPFTEDAPPYNDFLGDVCRQWEAASMEAAQQYRTAIFRLGIVLGKESGAFHEFERPMTFGIMPVLGSGEQVVSWIEVNDLANLLLYAIEQGHVSGIYNAVTSRPVTHRELMKTIAAVKGGIKIPAPVPAFILKMMIGEMSGEILSSRTVSGDKVLGTGFQFQYPDITSAVRAILKK